MQNSASGSRPIVDSKDLKELIEMVVEGVVFLGMLYFVYKLITS